MLHRPSQLGEQRTIQLSPVWTCPMQKTGVLEPSWPSDTGKPFDHDETQSADGGSTRMSSASFPSLPFCHGPHLLYLGHRYVPRCQVASGSLKRTSRTFGVVSGHETFPDGFTAAKTDKNLRLPDLAIRTFEAKSPCPDDESPILYTLVFASANAPGP